MPDSWLTGVWIPIVGILATVFVGIVAIVIAGSTAREAKNRALRAERSALADRIEKLFTLELMNTYNPALLNNTSLRRDAAAQSRTAERALDWTSSTIRSTFTREMEHSTMGIDPDPIWQYTDVDRFNAAKTEAVRRLAAWVAKGSFDLSPF